MLIVICPGIHADELNQGLIEALPAELKWLLVPPAIPPYSPWHLHNFVAERCDRSQPLVFLGFSAGVVGAIGAARQWQSQAGNVRTLIACDGWGVPLFAGFPTHRLSHDYFTHWSSQLLGGSQESFYAEPAVNHLHLWSHPRDVKGWQLNGSERHYTTAANYLNLLLQHYHREA
uniref:Uncharacterized protein n=1 Tax=Cyanothece sp. (strain PCC 7425 / ATCC 29141) TaxID=395961 RepID=B8HWF7_CYAP4